MAKNTSVESSNQEQPRDDNVVVSYSDIGKTYDGAEGSVVALEDINFEIQEGEFVSVVGPSGCGKSTLLHLTTILEPTTGSVEILGNDIHNDSAHEKHNVGLVFQDPVLLEWRTILKNVLLPIEILAENGVIDDVEMYRERAKELVKLVGLEGFEDSYPKELSGGMQQRVSICRSLVYDPPVLLMDEPFGALDALTRQEMNTELLRIWNETTKTILFVTHNLEEAVYLSDRVVVLSGRPGQVEDIVEIDIDRPRDDDVRQTDEFQDALGKVSQHFQ